jgi:hypothetical protein
MQRHSFLSLSAMPTISVLLLIFSLPAQAQGESSPTIPSVIHETEGRAFGTWTLANGQYNAGWSNGAIAVITVERFDSQSVILRRTDSSNSVSRGLTAVYTGRISGTGDSIQNGSVTWTWPGVSGYPATGTWNASWETVRIFHGGIDIIGTTPSVVVGQQINLRVALSNGVTCSRPMWRVQGLAVAGFEALPSFYKPEGGSAVPIDFTASSASKRFYWVRGGTFLVTASCMLGTQTLSSQVAFKVNMPNMATASAKLGKINIIQNSRRETLLKLGGSLSNLGIKFQTQPANTGAYQWVQIISGLEIVKYKPSGRTERIIISGALDTYYPYANYNNPDNFLMDDNPGVILESRFTAVSEVMSARMYLMWNPRLPTNCVPTSTINGAGTCTSISVPLGYIDWQWSGAAQYDASRKKWNLVPGSTSKFAKPFVRSSIFPSWERRFLSSCRPSCGPLQQNSLISSEFKLDQPE